MRLNTNSLKRTVAVFAAVCTLGACCVAGTAGLAQADGANTANIVKNQNTSITIYKYESPELNTRNDGTDQSASLGYKKPIEGVKFKITRIVKNDNSDIDLSTTDGWNAIKDLDVKDKSADAALKALNLKASDTDKKDGKTDNTGKVDFSLGTTYGLYLVEEDLSDSSPKKEGQPVKITNQVKPFLVTVPLPNAKDHNWIYQVKIYPKNDISDSKVEKKAATAPNKLYIDKADTTMDWNVSIPFTAIKNGGDKYTTVAFTDPIDTRYLNYKEVKDLQLVGKDGNSTENLVAGDYSVEGYSDNSTKIDNLTSDNLKNVKWIRVKLTDSGLTKASAKVGGKLKATIVTSVIAPGSAKNVLNTDVDGVATGEGNKPPCIPTDNNPCDQNTHEGESTTHFAKLTIKKIGLSTDGQTDGKPLKDAEFKVYPAAAGKSDTDIEGKTLDEATSNLDTANARQLSPTDEKGEASDSFFVGNGTTTTKVYCAVETKAPDGFNLDNKFHCFKLTTDEASMAKNNTKTINNKQATGLDQIIGALPMTGARGLVLLTACGIVGLGGTMFYIITRRRKEQEEA